MEVTAPFYFAFIRPSAWGVVLKFKPLSLNREELKDDQRLELNSSRDTEGTGNF